MPGGVISGATTVHQQATTPDPAGSRPTGPRAVCGIRGASAPRGRVGGAVRGGSCRGDRPQRGQTCRPAPPGGCGPAPGRAPSPGLRQQGAGVPPSPHEPGPLLGRPPSDAHGCRVLWPPALPSWRFPRMSPVLPPTALGVRPGGEAPWGGWRRRREAPSLHSRGPAPALVATHEDTGLNACETATSQIRGIGRRKRKGPRVTITVT